MKFSLIICTYMRPKAIITLLDSVEKQKLYPDEILVIDGSINDSTQVVFKEKKYENLRYFKVLENDRGLTKQRNFGISKVHEKSKVIAFLDDDTELTSNYFEVLIKTYINNPEITGVGGIALNEYKWIKIEKDKKYSSKKYYSIDKYVYKEGQRNVIRNYLGLQSNKLPGILPEFSNGRTCGYPLTGKLYDVDLLVGMSFSFKRCVFENLYFSTYFEGYGLYEDADYSIRALQFGKNVINTNLHLNHYHDASGRPNKFKYGKMVLRNGWYVWRVKYKNPSLVARFKWNGIAFILTMLRYLNVLTTVKKKEAFTEAIGRTYGWFSLIFNKPTILR